MKRQAALWAIGLALLTCTATQAGDNGVGEAPRPHFFARLKPRGGWNPDGRGIFHWWNPDCYPRTCGPDNYCRKPMPNVCRPIAPRYVVEQPYQAGLVPPAHP